MVKVLITFQRRLHHGLYKTNGCSEGQRLSTKTFQWHSDMELNPLRNKGTFYSPQNLSHSGCKAKQRTLFSGLCISVNMSLSLKRDIVLKALKTLIPEDLTFRMIATCPHRQNFDLCTHRI